jgi:integrase
VSGPLLLPRWDEFAAQQPTLTATMRRYLTQIACTLRPGSVNGADLALRCFAAFLVQCHPEIESVAAVTRRHIEDYKPWLAARPGQKVPRLTTNTIAHRLGNLRMFFIRLEEWGWDDAPPRVPIIAGDLPRQDHALPKALDDPAAARLLRAAQTQRRMLVRVVCEVLLRTGLRVSELTGLRSDAIMQIGAGHWLHVPVGKLGEDPTCRCTHIWSTSSTTTAPATSAPATRLRRDHFRLLGNGYCARPPELDCAFESICETCTFFQTSIEFRPTLQHQHDDAATKNQTGRQHLFSRLIHTLDTPTAS